MGCYVDTSVLVAYYLPERQSARVQQMLTRLETATISALVEVEFCSALSRKVRMRHLSRTAARQVLGMFRAHLADGLYHQVTLTRREFDLASDWLADFSSSLRTLDALHLAAAFTHEMKLLTADATLATAARSVGVRIQKL